MNKPDVDAAAIERNSLNVGKWGNLIMAFAGIGAAYASRSEALLIDGLYSGVNFVSAILAAKVSVAVAQRPDRQFPFGYAVCEAIYVNFRSIVLLGIMGAAAFGGIQKILAYAGGAEFPELVHGPIAIYTVAMVSICAALGAWHYYNWQRAGKRSEILKTESKAAVVDGVISAGAGGGLLATTFLKGTSLDFLIPIADSIVVLVMTACMIRQPLGTFLGSLRELAGGAARSEDVPAVEEKVRQLFETTPHDIVELSTVKLGRTFFMVIYIRPHDAIRGPQVDELTETIRTQAEASLGETQVAIVITDTSPFD